MPVDRTGAPFRRRRPRAAPREFCCCVSSGSATADVARGDSGRAGAGARGRRSTWSSAAERGPRPPDGRSRQRRDRRRRVACARGGGGESSTSLARRALSWRGGATTWRSTSRATSARTACWRWRGRGDGRVRAGRRRPAPHRRRRVRRRPAHRPQRSGAGGARVRFASRVVASRHHRCRRPSVASVSPEAAAPPRVHAWRSSTTPADSGRAAAGGPRAGWPRDQAMACRAVRRRRIGAGRRSRCLGGP